MNEEKPQLLITNKFLPQAIFEDLKKEIESNFEIAFELLKETSSELFERLKNHGSVIVEIVDWDTHPRMTYRHSRPRAVSNNTDEGIKIEIGKEYILNPDIPVPAICIHELLHRVVEVKEHPVQVWSKPSSLFFEFTKANGLDAERYSPEIELRVWDDLRIDELSFKRDLGITDIPFTARYFVIRDGTNTGEDLIDSMIRDSELTVVSAIYNDHCPSSPLPVKGGFEIYNNYFTLLVIGNEDKQGESILSLMENSYRNELCQQLKELKHLRFNPEIKVLSNPRYIEIEDGNTILYRGTIGMDQSWKTKSIADSHITRIYNILMYLTGLKLYEKYMDDLIPKEEINMYLQRDIRTFLTERLKPSLNEIVVYLEKCMDKARKTIC